MIKFASPHEPTQTISEIVSSWVSQALSSSRFSLRQCKWGWPNTTEPWEPPSYVWGTGNSHTHTPCGLCFHCILCYAKEYFAAERSLTQSNCNGRYLCLNLWWINPQLNVAVNTGKEGSWGWGEKSGDLLAFAGGFSALLPVGFHGSVLQLGKAKRRPSKLLQNMSRFLWKAENVQLPGRSSQVLCALPKWTIPWAICICPAPGMRALKDLGQLVVLFEALWKYPC